ncbi:hypothetical protein H9P43_006397 [Blastocladiella emersonii ATCC 22665]|nr:hypothetical protein H9P43_006397 [Blastocladiella emersonii ATCC 22665]
MDLPETSTTSTSTAPLRLRLADVPLDHVVLFPDSAQVHRLLTLPASPSSSGATISVDEDDASSATSADDAKSALANTSGSSASSAVSTVTLRLTGITAAVDLDTLRLEPVNDGSTDDLILPEVVAKRFVAPEPEPEPKVADTAADTHRTLTTSKKTVASGARKLLAERDTLRAKIDILEANLKAHTSPAPSAVSADGTHAAALPNFEDATRFIDQTMAVILAARERLAEIDDALADLHDEEAELIKELAALDLAAKPAPRAVPAFATVPSTAHSDPAKFDVEITIAVPASAEPASFNLTYDISKGVAWWPDYLLEITSPPADSPNPEAATARLTFTANVRQCTGENWTGCPIDIAVSSMAKPAPPPAPFTNTTPFGAAQPAPTSAPASNTLTEQGVLFGAARPAPVPPPVSSILPGFGMQGVPFGAAPTQATAGFGSATAPARATGFTLGGAPASSPASGGSVFGGAPATSSPLGASSSATTTTTTPAFGSSAFGAPVTTTAFSTLGTAAPAPTAFGAPTKTAFGASTTTAFGAPAPMAPSAPFNGYQVYGTYEAGNFMAKAADPRFADKSPEEEHVEFIEAAKTKKAALVASLAAPPFVPKSLSPFGGSINNVGASVPAVASPFGASAPTSTSTTATQPASTTAATVAPAATTSTPFSAFAAAPGPTFGSIAAAATPSSVAAAQQALTAGAPAFGAAPSTFGSSTATGTAAAAQPSAFGSSSSTAAGTAAPPLAFGSSTGSEPSSFTFGKPSTAAAPPAFGTTSTLGWTPGATGFGSSTSGVFGNTNTGGAFGSASAAAAKPAASTSLFGTAPTAAAAVPSLFGTIASEHVPASVAPATNTAAFGSAAPPPAAGFGGSFNLFGSPPKFTRGEEFGFFSDPAVPLTLRDVVGPPMRERAWAAQVYASQQPAFATTASWPGVMRPMRVRVEAHGGITSSDLAVMSLVVDRIELAAVQLCHVAVIAEASTGARAHRMLRAVVPADEQFPAGQCRVVVDGESLGFVTNPPFLPGQHCTWDLGADDAVLVSSVTLTTDLTPKADPGLLARLLASRSEGKDAVLMQYTRKFAVYNARAAPIVVRAAIGLYARPISDTSVLEVPTLESPKPCPLKKRDDRGVDPIAVLTGMAGDLGLSMVHPQVRFGGTVKALPYATPIWDAAVETAEGARVKEWLAQQDNAVSRTVYYAGVVPPATKTVDRKLTYTVAQTAMGKAKAKDE